MIQGLSDSDGPARGRESFCRLCLRRGDAVSTGSWLAVGQCRCSRPLAITTTDRDAQRNSNERSHLFLGLAINCERSAQMA
jgi:hypothetical protein